MNKGVVAAGAVVLVAAGGYFFIQTQKEDSSAVGQRSAPPPALDAAVAPTHGVTRYAVSEQGNAGFVIDAPLEKIKGHASKLRGSIDLDPDALAASSGEIDVDLSTLVTETFGDPAKDTAQTGHAQNWMELGADSPNREADRWARFTFAKASVAGATASRLSDVPVTDGARKFQLTVTGNLWLHGVTSPKVVVLSVVARPGATADAPPASLHVETAEPMTVSLKEHDVKPRDVAGKFLAGSLEKVGDKITDSAKVSVALDAAPAGPSILDASGK